MGKSDNLKFCGHCGFLLSKAAFYEHRKIYYNRDSGTWTKNTATGTSHVDDIQERPTSSAIVSEHDQLIHTGLAYQEDAQYDEGGGDDESTSSSEQVTRMSSPNLNVNDDLEIADEVLPEIWTDEELEELEQQGADRSWDVPGASDDSVDTDLIKGMIHFTLSWQNYYKISDNAIQVQFQFLKHFMSDIAVRYKDNRLLNFEKQLPATLHSARRIIDVERDDFSKYPTCVDCNSTVEPGDAVVKTASGARESATCSHIEFPNHPQKKKRKPCGQTLCKRVQGKDDVYFYPKKLYCYRGVIDYLREMVKRRHFWERCERWKNTKDSDNDLLTDVHDGNVWKENEPYFCDQDYRSIGLMINIDWFQPYDQSTYSLGALYLVIQNLPREERFLEENVMLIGVIPGPHEPSLHVNTFLKYLVDELLQLYDGVYMEDETEVGSIYRAMLLCLSSDIPATRKCGGFVGHSAARGCSKCCRNFTTPSSVSCRCDSNLCHGGFSDHMFEPRNDAEHRDKANESMTANSAAERQRIEAEFGVRYSELHRLPYFDSVRMHVVDPMHNLLTGTGSRLVKHWISNDILTDEVLEEIQKEINSMELPASLGRIPAKIKSGFSNFTADEWKNFIVIFSLPTLKGRIPEKHYNCWMLFAKACITLCARTLRRSDLESTHVQLLKFCKDAEALYGCNFCTINMHLHVHLKKCIEDYGPIHNFWCFSFERDNGILGKYKTNNHSISLQVMRKFVQNRYLVNLSLWNDSPDCYQRYSALLIPQQKRYRGSLRQTMAKSTIKFGAERMNCISLGLQDYSSENGDIMPLTPSVEIVIDEDTIPALEAIFMLLYPKKQVKIVLFARRFSRLVRHDELYRSTLASNENQSSCVEALWVSDETNDTATIDTSVQSSRVGCVEYFILVEAIISDPTSSERKKVYFANVNWFKIHPHRRHFARPVQVWCTQYEPSGNASMIPVDRIISACTILKKAMIFPDGLRETVHISSPIYQNLPMWT